MEWTGDEGMEAAEATPEAEGHIRQHVCALVSFLPFWFSCLCLLISEIRRHHLWISSLLYLRICEHHIVCGVGFSDETNFHEKLCGRPHCLMGNVVMLESKSSMRQQICYFMTVPIKAQSC